MKKFVKIISVMAAAAVALTACSKAEPIVGTNDGDGLFINKGATTIIKGQSETLVATVTPKSNATVVWGTSDEAVATVDAKGVVTAVGAGDCDITAKYGNGVVKCAVHVNSPVTTVELSPVETINGRGVSQEVSITVGPEDINVPYEITWTSSDENVFKVVADATDPKKATITSVKGGKARLMVKAGDVDTSAPVTVFVALEGIEMEGDVTTKIYVGETRQFSVKKNPEDATDDLENIVWSTSDEEIATFDETGLLTTKKNGTVTLKVEANGFEATKELKVNVEKTITLEFTENKTEYTVEDVTLTIHNNSGSARFYSAYYGWYLLSGDGWTISVPEGLKVSAVNFTAAYSGASDFTVDSGSYTRSGNSHSWTGDAQSVTFTASGTIYQKTFTISYKD